MPDKIGPDVGTLLEEDERWPKGRIHSGPSLTK